jgi:hypothetical protein
VRGRRAELRTNLPLEYRTVALLLAAGRLPHGVGHPKDMGLRTEYYGFLRCGGVSRSSISSFGYGPTRSKAPLLRKDLLGVRQSDKVKQTSSGSHKKVVSASLRNHIKGGYYVFEPRSVISPPILILAGFRILTPK